MQTDEAVVPASQVQALQQQIKELQRLLGKKTMENEILKEAVEYARGKSYLCARRDRRRALSSGQGVPGARCGSQQCGPEAITGSAVA